MTCQVVILRQAEQDLRELRGYLMKTFGQAVWQSSYADIKAAILNLAAFPYSGAIPEALEQLQLVQYRQIISGSNRIIYEVREKTVYIHLVVDCRRDMKSVLMRRLLRSEE
jgi:plasmid stabilization system protein ParE